MNKLLFYSIFAATLATLPGVANAAPHDWHRGGHIHYVTWHGHRGHWEGVRFVVVEPAPAPIVVPAYYPQPYPQPVYYAPAPIPAF